MNRDWTKPSGPKRGELVAYAVGVPALLVAGMIFGLFSR